MGRRTQRVKKRRTRRHFNPRPFNGLRGETEWVALRELIPAATAPLRLKDPTHAERSVTLTTVLPMAHPALVKPDGRIFLAAQADERSGDLSRDLAAVLLAAMDAKPGTYISVTPDLASGPTLQDLLAPECELTPTLHESFQFWLDDTTPDEDVTASLEKANEAITPTLRMSSALSAYWCSTSHDAYLRWVLPHDEHTAMNALARLHASGDLTLGKDTRYAGSFRSSGLLIPIFDVPRDTPAPEWEVPLAHFSHVYAHAATREEDLTSREKRSRDAVQTKVLSLR